MKGITGFTKGKAALSVLPNTPPGEVWPYGGVAHFRWRRARPPFSAVFGWKGKGNIDFVNGSDVILFDDLSHIRFDNTIPLFRNEIG